MLSSKLEELLSKLRKESYDTLLKQEALQKAEKPSILSQQEYTSLEDEKRKSELERYKSDTNDRRWLAEWAAFVVSFWLLLVLVMLVNSQRYSLDSNVLITLLATTTVNVLGLMLIVLKGHFK